MRSASPIALALLDATTLEIPGEGTIPGHYNLTSKGLCTATNKQNYCCNIRGFHGSRNVSVVKTVAILGF
jgi:hypothetical protein